MKPLILITVLLFNLSCKEPTQSTIQEVSSISTSDTLIGRRAVTNEIAGSAYRKQATGYFVIFDQDTSDFMPVFYELKNNEVRGLIDGKVGLDLNIPYIQNNITYHQRMEELKSILPQAATDYNFDSLRGVSIGRLILMGDLAVKVTNQYTENIGEAEQSNTLVQSKSEYKRIEDFLFKSQLTADFNELFKPYSLMIDKIYLEKIFFTTREELLNYSTLEMDSNKVPSKIFDCAIGMTLKKN